MTDQDLPDRTHRDIAQGLAKQLGAYCIIKTSKPPVDDLTKIFGNMSYTESDWFFWSWREYNRLLLVQLVRGHLILRNERAYLILAIFSLCDPDLFEQLEKWVDEHIRECR